MGEDGVLGSIRGMVEAEHALREQMQRGEVDVMPARAELAELERSLDQCWDLLRQRRARAEFDQDPDRAVLRPVEVVERYWA